MNQYQLLALDMDGTLLNRDAQISEENRYWISKAMEQGITVCLSTGRGIGNIRPFAAQLGLQSPIVAVNGSEVWKNPDVLHQRYVMDPQAISEMKKTADRYDAWFWAYSSEGLHNKEKWPEELTDKEWLKFGYYSEDDSVRQELWEYVDSLAGFEVTNSHPCNIEINPKGVSKASGLQSISQLLNIPLSRMVAMGDSLNDLAMIRAVGLGIAMGNGMEQLKAAADLVTVTNEEHAVATVIRTVLLQQERVAE